MVSIKAIYISANHVYAWLSIGMGQVNTSTAAAMDPS